ncbi:hypothetical protein A2U01_0001772 [Trifolium medium]|uniref:Uncharacterized protein n=1 Tax=Trifolium medium TaxID=97028 RepID=A0A392M300_9FABA|nr:hypothetical protein [Trifolium medium]
MTNDELVVELERIHEKMTRSLKRTFEDIYRDASSSEKVTQKVNKKLKSEDVKLLTTAPWFEPRDLKFLELMEVSVNQHLQELIKAEKEEKLRQVILQELTVHLEENHNLLVSMEAQNVSEEGYNLWIQEGEAMVQALAREGETFATRRIQANLTKQRVLIEKVMAEQSRQAGVQAKLSEDIAAILAHLQPPKP